MKRRIMIIIFVLFIALWCTWFVHHQPVPTVNLEENVITIKQLKPLTDEYVRQYDSRCCTDSGRRNNPNRYFEITSMNIYLDKAQRGELLFEYTEQNQKNRRIYYVRINTLERKIYGIRRADNGRGSRPHVLHIDDWKVDSDKVIEIAEKILEDHGYSVKYNRMVIGVNTNYDTGEERISVDFKDDSNELSFDYPTILLDPYTSELLRPIEWSHEYIPFK